MDNKPIKINDRYQSPDRSNRAATIFFFPSHVRQYVTIIMASNIGASVVRRTSFNFVVEFYRHELKEFYWENSWAIDEHFFPPSRPFIFSLIRLFSGKLKLYPFFVAATLFLIAPREFGWLSLKLIINHLRINTLSLDEN